jgi:hypothetical protein
MVFTSVPSQTNLSVSIKGLYGIEVKSMDSETPLPESKL